MKIRRKLKNHAVSQVVSTLLTLMIVIGSVAAILFWGLPYIEERKLRSQSQNAINSFNLMYNTIHSMIIDGPNTKGVSEVITTSDQGALTIDPYGNKLVIMYSFDSDYDFNVSGLDDGDDSFKINMAKGNLHRVEIYWLNPGNADTGASSSRTTFRRIYKDESQDLKCSQSFKVVGNTELPDPCKLEKINLYLERRGAIYEDLNVSIYDCSGPSDDPSGNNFLGYMQIPFSEIPSSMGWVECDLSSKDIQLNQNAMYHILLNTTGGTCGNGVYNYYKWHLYKENYYEDDGRAFTSTDGGSNWIQEDSGDIKYDFSYRVYYGEDNSIPNKPWIQPPICNSSTTTYSGIDHEFNVSTVDHDEGDDTYFKIDWGDGTNTSWLGPHQSYSTRNWYDYGDFPYAKIWKQPGRYTVTVKVKDENNSIAKIDNSTTIDVVYGNHIPNDAYHLEFQSNGASSDPWTVSTTEDLNGTLRIDLFNDNYPAEPEALMGKVPFGRIFVFDLGCIKYTSPYSVGKQQTIFENGAVISEGYIGNKLKSKPSFFEEDDAIAFRVIQIGKNFAGGGGIGTYRLGFTMHNNTAREVNISKVYNFKLHMNGSDQDVIDILLNYFDNTYEFDDLIGWDNTVYYTEEGKRLLFDNSYLQAELEGMI